MKVLWVAIMMTAPALAGAYEMWAACTDDQGPVSDCKGCTFSCYKDGWEVKECKCTCDDDGTTDNYAKFWYSCDKTKCNDSDNCMPSPDSKESKESKDSKDKCEYDRLSTWQEDNCADKDSKGSCEDCCEYYCDEKHDKDDCFDEWEDCVDDCIDDASCKGTKDSKDSKDDCKYDRLWEWQEKECKKEDSYGRCEDCCEDYCDRYHDKYDCSDEWEDCVDDCVEDAPCDEATGDSSDKCDFLSSSQYNKCGDKSSKSKCKNCCWNKCGDENPKSSRCREKCYAEAKMDADCSKAGGGGGGGKCDDRKEECCDCVDKCVEKKSGYSAEKDCIRTQCRDEYCKDAAKTCSGYSRSEWKDFITDKCKFKFE
jgi:hypothetical protein